MNKNRLKPVQIKVERSKASRLLSILLVGSGVALTLPFAGNAFAQTAGFIQQGGGGANTNVDAPLLTTDGAGSLTAVQLSATSATAGSISASTTTTGTLSATNVTADALTSGSVSASTTTTGTLSATSATAGSISASTTTTGTLLSLIHI